MVQRAALQSREPPRTLPATLVRAEVGKAARAGYIGVDAPNSGVTARSCRPSTSDSRSTPATPNPGRVDAALACVLSYSWGQCSLLRALARLDFATRSLDG